MPDNNMHVFFVDDELVERLMRGDAGESPANKRPAESSVLAAAIKLATGGRLEEAVRQLEQAAQQGANPVEVYTALGHLRFEQQKWEEAAASYRKVVEADAR